LVAVLVLVTDGGRWVNDEGNKGGRQEIYQFQFLPFEMRGGKNGEVINQVWCERGYKINASDP
jgi:hypothetical protein